MLAPDPEVHVFRHVLVPTDGSSRSESTAREAVALAKLMGGRSPPSR